MTIACDIVEEPVSVLLQYSRVPIRFDVHSVLEIGVLDSGLGGIQFTERKLEAPYEKDHDAMKGEGPTRWAKRWGISNWGIISAFVDEQRIGGCVLAYDTDGVFILEGRKDIAVLWDLRVDPDWRRQGIGSKLFVAAVAWATKRRCRTLKIETQNNNVPACRFYAKHGCVLGSINRFAYDELPDEVELLWYKMIWEPPNRRRQTTRLTHHVRPWEA